MLAAKVAIITGASSGIGSVSPFFVFLQSGSVF